jgi:hypothetical protein
VRSGAVSLPDGGSLAHAEVLHAYALPLNKTALPLAGKANHSMPSIDFLGDILDPEITPLLSGVGARA